MSKMHHYKLDGHLPEPQKKTLIFVGMFPFILEIRSACKFVDANEF